MHAVSDWDDLDVYENASKVLQVMSPILFTLLSSGQSLSLLFDHGGPAGAWVESTVLNVK